MVDSGGTAMRTWADEQTEKLSEQYPAWQIWTVPKLNKTSVWCARRHDNHKIVLNADGPDELAEIISQHEGVDRPVTSSEQ